MSNEKEKVTYNKADLLVEICRATRVRYSVVKKVYNELEDLLAQHLSEANNSTDVSVRLFKGISVDSEFLPEKVKLNNITGDVITTIEKIKPKAKVTRQYCEKITDMAIGSEDESDKPGLV